MEVTIKMQVIGYATVKNTISKTKYVWGNPSEITGKKLIVIDRNKFGDCLCVSDKGLVDVNVEDVEIYTPSIDNFNQRVNNATGR
jgi:hypothetical protein